ncbi:MAG: hypothetical protein V3V08_08120 [Nannocystaceae bacterium]
MAVPQHPRADSRIQAPPWSSAASEAQRLGTDLDALRRNAALNAEQRLAQLEEFLALREACRR